MYVVVSALLLTGYIVLTYVISATSTNLTVLLSVSGSAALAILIGYFALRSWLIGYFMPGEIVYDVSEADESIVTANVLGAHFSILGLISLFAMKLMGCNGEKAAVAEEKEEESSVSGEEVVMVNNME